MRRMLSLGLFMIMCSSFMVGCSNKMSMDKIGECEQQENDLESDLESATDIFKSIDINSDIIWSTDDQKEIDKAWGRISDKEESIKEIEDNLKKISLNKLLKYHNHMVEYRGTTQEHEDNEFIRVNYQYLLTKRRLACSKEIISLYDDGNISEEEHNKIIKIGILSCLYLKYDEDSTMNDVQILQRDLDEKYSLDSKTLRELHYKVEKMEDENEY